MIVRYGPPSKMDTAPLGTLCKVSNSSNKVEIYKQISNDEDDPHWILIQESSSDTFTTAHKVTDNEI